MPRSRLDELTPREREVLALVARHCTNGGIAGELGISFDTAKSHVSNILSKLGVDTREEAAALWRNAHSTRARLLAIPAAVVHLGLLQRALIGVAALAGVGGLAVGIGFGTGTISTSSPPPTITVPLSELKPGQPVAFYPPSDGEDQLGNPFPVWVVREYNGSIEAFLGRNPQFNCPARWSDQTVPAEINRSSPYPAGGFREGCGGAIYLIDGTWYFGPAPRDLDRYPVTVEGQEAVIHLAQLVPGGPLPTSGPDSGPPTPPGWKAVTGGAVTPAG